MRDRLRTLVAGALHVFGLRLPAAWRLRPSGHFWWLLPPAMTLSVVRDRLSVELPANFYLDGIQSDALAALLCLAAASLMARLAGQRVLGWSLAVHASSMGLWLSAAAIGLWQALACNGWRSPKVDMGLLMALCLWWLLAWTRLLLSMIPGWRWWRAAPAAMLAAGLTLAPPLIVDAPRYWYPDYTETYSDDSDAQAPPERKVPGSAEQLMYRQPALVQAALERLQPGIPGQTDAWLLAFGGDGNEDVFRNEVEYAESLFAKRFGTDGRTIALLNHPDTTASTPLASLSNLKLALAGLATRMDPKEDLLILFLTSHGSKDHQLYVDMQPLPLDWISPQALRAALDDAGIQWRVVIVSACYSGGFIDALGGPMALVMTAARADRPSFGCGADSEITYFGRAFLVDALNQTRSLPAAFELAREGVATREAAEDFEASDPQISLGALIASRLQRWSEQLPHAAPLPFVPAVPKTRCERDDETCP